MLASRRRVEDVPAMSLSNHETAIDRTRRARCAAAPRAIAARGPRERVGVDGRSGRGRAHLRGVDAARQPGGVRRGARI
jgi:hypothetical protein